jgi:hypothetical protein
VDCTKNQPQALFGHFMSLVVSIRSVLIQAERAVKLGLMAMENSADSAPRSGARTFWILQPDPNVQTKVDVGFKSNYVLICTEHEIRLRHCSVRKLRRAAVFR